MKVSPLPLNPTAPGWSCKYRLAVLLLLVSAAYIPSLNIPLIEDDYPNIAQSITYGPISGISALFTDSVFRLRATSYWVMFVVWQAFGLLPIAYHCVSLLIHLANVLLLYHILLFIPITRTSAFWIAAFFAVHEGHQEAVMWFSAINELLMFLFLAAALILWLMPTRRRGIQDTVGILFFGLALLSKESAVISLLIVYLATVGMPARRRFGLCIVCASLGLLAVASIYGARQTSFRFSDGSFSLTAPFWITLPRSLGRLLWFWGVVSAGYIVWLREQQFIRRAFVILVLMAAALAPYSFLTYSTQIPSRQVYLASVGLAVLVGLCMERASSVHRQIASLIFVVAILHNLVYLWTKKHDQFVARAAPTEQLISALRYNTGPVWIKCFPRSAFLARETARLVLGFDSSKLVWNARDAELRNATIFLQLDENGVCRAPSDIEAR